MEQMKKKRSSLRTKIRNPRWIKAISNAMTANDLSFTLTVRKNTLPPYKSIRYFLFFITERIAKLEFSKIESLVVANRHFQMRLESDMDGYWVEAAEYNSIFFSLNLVLQEIAREQRYNSEYKIDVNFITPFMLRDYVGAAFNDASYLLPVGLNLQLQSGVEHQIQLEKIIGPDLDFVDLIQKNINDACNPIDFLNR